MIQERSTRQAAPYFPLFVLCLNFFASHIARMNWAPLIPTAGTELGFSNAESGLVMSSFHLGYVGSQLLTGQLADRLTAKTILAWSQVAMALSVLMFGLVRSLVPAIVLRVAAGIMGGCIYPCIIRAVGQSFPIEKQGRMLGFVFAAPPRLPGAGGPAEVILDCGLQSSPFSYLTSLGFLSPSSISQLVFFYGVVGLVSSPFWGAISDWANTRKYTLLGVLVLDMVAILVLGNSRTIAFGFWLAVLAARAFVGFSVGALHTGWVLEVTRRFDLVGTGAGLSNSMVQSGGIVGPVLFGYILDLTSSYRIPWLVLAASLAASALVFWRVPERRALRSGQGRA